MSGIDLGQSSADAIAAADERMCLEIDAYENTRANLPEGEHVDLVSVWAAECYTPSMVDDLVQHVRTIGWCEGREAFPSSQTPLDTWIQERRWKPGGSAYYPLNLIVRSEDKDKWFPPSLTADLPAEVERASGALYHAFPGLFVLVIKFQLSETMGERISSVLNKVFHTRVEVLGHGRSYVGPIRQRTQLVEQLRTQAVRFVTDWIREYVPGIFSKSEDPTIFPSCEFITLELGDPLNAQRRSANWGSYLGVLGLERGFDVWCSDEFAEIRLMLPDSFRNQSNRLTLAGNAGKVLGNVDLTPYGGRTRFGFSHYLDYFSPFLADWALGALLTVYEREYAAIRERISRALNTTDLTTGIEVTGSLEAKLLRVSADAVTVATEMLEYLKVDALFAFLGKDFYAVDPFRAGIDPKPGKESKLVDRRGAPLPLNNGRSRGRGLMASARTGMIPRCTWMLNTERQAREFLQSESSLLNARAQYRLGTSNLKLQKVVIFLSIVVLIFGIVQTVITWKSYSFDDDPSVVATRSPSAISRILTYDPLVDSAEGVIGGRANATTAEVATQ